LPEEAALLPLLPNDEPTTDDLLGHARQVDEVLAFLGRVRPPYVLGVHGDWGTGKTSFLHKLQQQLGANKTARKSRVVFFEAWRHQFEEQPVVALLHTIREHFSLQQRVWEQSGKLASVAAWTGLRMLDDLAAGVVQAGREEGEGWEARNFAVPLGSESFRSAFEGAIASLTGKGDARLVVLIDDLDRCGDAAVVRLLEGLKLYLNAHNCVFVIAADRRAVVRAIHRQLFSEGSPRDAEEYAEKLFQAVIPLRLAVEVRDFIGAFWSQDPAHGQRLIELQRAHRFLPSNPRKIKRFLVELQARLQSCGDRPVDLDLLAAVQAVQTFHPDVFRILEAEPDFWNELVAQSREPVADCHEVLRGLKVPDRGARRQSGDLSTGWAPTFLDPGDQAVLWAARLLRALPPPTQQALHLALLREAQPEPPTLRPSP